MKILNQNKYNKLVVEKGLYVFEELSWPLHQKGGIEIPIRVW